MTKLTIALLALLALVACKGKDTNPTTDEQKASYAIGFQVGRELKNQGAIKPDVDVIATAINDVLTDKKIRLTPEEMQKAMQLLNEKMMARQMEDMKKNLEESNKFLEQNKGRPGVKTTASGLQYEVLAEGKGGKPSATSQVKVHYKGTLINGTEFDSSYKRGEPAEFPLNGVIPGWTEGVQLMGKGAKYRFVVPPGLAYGERGRPGIPPNSALVFEVELIDFKAAPAEKKK